MQVAYVSYHILNIIIKSGDVTADSSFPMKVACSLKTCSCDRRAPSVAPASSCRLTVINNASIVLIAFHSTVLASYSCFQPLSPCLTPTLIAPPPPKLHCSPFIFYLQSAGVKNAVRRCWISHNHSSKLVEQSELHFTNMHRRLHPCI